MSIIRQYEGDVISKVTVTPDIEVGSRRMYLDPTYGWGEYEFIVNKSAGALSKGLGCMRKSTLQSQADISGAAVANCRMIGVAQWDIPKDAYGWVLVRGYGVSQSNGTQTVNTPQKTAAAGQFTDGTIGADEMCVFAIGDDGGVAGTNVLSYVHCS